MAFAVAHAQSALTAWLFRCSISKIFVVLIAVGTLTTSLSSQICVHEQPPTWPNEQTTQAEPSIAVWKDIILVAFVDTRHYNPLRPGRSSLVNVARSTDGGQTFQELGPPPPCAWCHGLSNPTLAASPSGVFYLCSLQEEYGLRVGLARSEDGGASFTRPVLLPKVGEIPDLPHMVVNPADERVYVAWADLMLWQIFVAFSEDGGYTFASPVPIGTPGPLPKHCPRLAVGNNNQIYIFWIQGNAIWGSMSKDRGLSWDEPVLLTKADLVWYLRDGITVPPIPQPAVDPLSGNIYIAFPSASDALATDVFVMIVDSELNLISPPKPVIQNFSPGQERFMPATAISPNGVLGIAFYEREAFSGVVTLNVLVAFSTDQGESFWTQRISSAPFLSPPSYDPVRRPNYMGDYIALVADARFFYVAWADTRHWVKTPSYKEGRPDLDVYFLKLPVP